MELHLEKLQSDSFSVEQSYRVLRDQSVSLEEKDMEATGLVVTKMTLEQVCEQCAAAVWMLQKLQVYHKWKTFLS